MVGAFSCRRLLDSKKVESGLVKKKIVISRVQFSGTEPRYWHENPGWFPELFELYDFAGATDCAVPLGELLNQLIHSHHLVYLRVDGDLLVLVASDRKRHSGLFAVWLSQVAVIFEEVSLTEPEYVVNGYRKDRGRYDLQAEGSMVSDRLVDWGFAKQVELVRGPR